MAAPAVEFSIVGVDKASGSFDDIASSSEQSSRRIRESSEEAAGGLSNTAEGADTLASKGAQAAGALSGLGQTIGGPFGTAMQGAGFAMQTAADSGDLLNAAIEGGGKAMQAVGGWAKKFAVATGLMSAATEGETAAQWSLNTAFLANPMTWIVVAIVAVVAGIVLLATKTTWGKKLVSDAWNGIKAAASAVADFFTKDVPAAFGKVTAAASSVVGWVKSHWPLLLAIITGPIGLAVLAVTKNWDKIKSGATAVKDWIVTKFNAVVSFVRGLPAKITSAAGNLFHAITDKAAAIVGSYSSGGGGVKGRLFSIVDSVRSLPGRVTSAAGNTFHAITDKAAAIVGSYSSGGGGVKGRLFSIVSFVTGMPGRISRAASGMFDGLSDSFKSAINWIIGKWNGLSFTLPSMTVFGHKIGGATLSTPDIPYLATGGTIAAGGWAVVGEKGPELAHLPTGATVYPHGKAPAAANKNSPVHIENFYSGGLSPAQIAAELAWQSRKG